jgi:hypothetical protein
VQRSALIGADPSCVPLDDPVDPMVGVVLGGNGPIVFSKLLAVSYTQEVRQDREHESAER